MFFKEVKKMCLKNSNIPFYGKKEALIAYKNLLKQLFQVSFKVAQKTSETIRNIRELCLKRGANQQELNDAFTQANNEVYGDSGYC